MQTLRRELRQKFEAILYNNTTRDSIDMAEDLADAALEVAGIARTAIPEGSDPSWGMMAGETSESIALGNAKILREREVASTWEKLMGYNPLEWWSDRRLEKLLRFLSGKTPEEMRTFAAWSKRPFSSFGPEKARQNPQIVIDLWPQAFVAAAGDAEVYEEM